MMFRSSKTVLATVAFGAFLITGCANGPSGGPKLSAVGDATTAAASPRMSLPESADAQEAARLSAIEDFLARTADYSSSDRVTSSGVPEARDQAPPREIAVRQGIAALSNEREPNADSVPSFGTEPASVPDRSIDSHDQVAANVRMSLPAPRTPRQALPTVLSVSVRTHPVAPMEHHAEVPGAPSGVTNVALDVRGTPSSFSFDDWLADLEIEADNGRNFPAEWKLRFVELAIGRDASTSDLGSALSGETRSLLVALFQTVQAVREVVSNPIASGDAALAQAEVLVAALAERADPVISTVALCQRVVTFGVYDEMPFDSLIAGRDIQTIIYSEIQNLRALPTEDGRFETRLATRLELFNASGVSVWLKEEPEIVDACRRRRSDFFIAQRVTFPPTLPAGDYTLKVAVEDRQANRLAEHVTPIVIQSPISVARGG